MSNIVAREAIGAAQRILDPLFNSYNGGKRRFLRERKAMIRSMTAEGSVKPAELENAARTMPNLTNQQVRDQAYRNRAGIWCPPGEPENG